MEVGLFILILLFAGVVSYIAKNQASRMVIGAIFGLFYFVFWPHFTYYASLVELSESIISTVLYTSIVLLFLLSISPCVRQAHPIAGGSSLALFFIFGFSTLGMENSIRDWIADLSGFYSANNPITPDTALRKGERIFNYNDGGISFVIPGQWEEKTVSGANQAYLELTNDSRVIAEIRPQCFHGQKTPLADITANVLQSSGFPEQKDIHCFYWNKGIKSCLIRQGQEGKYAKRWHWYLINGQISQRVLLDLVLYEDNQKAITDFERVLSSAQVLPSLPQHPFCTTIADWL